MDCQYKVYSLGLVLYDSNGFLFYQFVRTKKTVNPVAFYSI